MKPQEIKDLRLEKKLTQEVFGELLGVSKAAVSRWEKGIDSPSGSSMKLLDRLTSGEIVVTELTDLEIKLLDQNVSVGRFNDREDYLTKSLKHLLLYGSFMPMEKFPAALGLVAEDEDACDHGDISKIPRKRAHIMAAAGSGIQAEVMDWEGGDHTVHVKVCGDSMLPKFKDGDVIDMKHKRASRSPFMKKGMIYLVQKDDEWMVKEYQTRRARPDEKDAEYLTSYGTVGILRSLNPEYDDIDIKDGCEWYAWYEGKA